MANNLYKYFILHKPYGVLSQFTDKEGRRTLSELHDFPRDVYPVGRLDMDSEGLLLLTDDKRLTNFLLNPLREHEKEYYVQVERIPEEADLENFRKGLLIEGKMTLPAKVKIIPDPGFPERNPSVRERKSVADCWLSVTLTEGRHRQVRKMTANIGNPTLRLVRVRIKNLFLDGLAGGDVRELSQKEIEGLKR